MSLKMWRVPASPNYIKYISIIGFSETVPNFEHIYLGKQLTTKGSLAEQVIVDENRFRIMYNLSIEDRQFYFESSSSSWFVLLDDHLQ